MKVIATPHRIVISAMTDAQALREISLGNLGALAVIYDRYRACLYRFFANATRYAQDVDDLVQTTFLSASRAAGSFDGRDSCRAWLLRIGSSLLFRRRRTLDRWGRCLREFAISQEGFGANAERQICAKRELNAVARALSGLSERKRVVLLLAHLEELPREEIARALDVPIGTVWTRLHYARLELRDRLTAEEKQR